MENPTKWKTLVPTAAVIVSLILFVFSYSRLQFTATWSSDELSAGAEPAIGSIDLGHGPVVHHPDQESNGFSVRLHSEERIHREPRTEALELNITKGLERPDGVLKQVCLVNRGRGPTIELRSGDELRVTVRNQLAGREGVSIHWHGLKIANQMDGVVGLTQSNLLPGHAHTSVLSIPNEQAGTFRWHSPDPASEADRYGVEDEQVLMVGDWYHQGAAEVLESYEDWKEFKIEPAPDSLLVNGVGLFACTKAMQSRPLDCKESVLPHLTLAGRTRLRIINTGSLTGFSVSTTGYLMTLIQVDGGNSVDPVSSENIGTLYPGERVDLILERRESEVYESAWITIALDRENMQFPNLALTDRQQFPISPDLDHKRRGARQVNTRNLKAPEVSWIDLAAVNGSSNLTGGLDTTADQTVLLYSTIEYLTEDEYRPKGFINHTSWNPSSHSSAPLLSLERKDWPQDAEQVVVRTH
ncbi:Laccase-2 [Lecanosticta acicola]|uniref:Laccase-2, partial n=1 Tax=Lecanosticta acicola TaxID=111012 RepID=A0AAI9EEJ9_9PEZI|nr:Laccase-2 [Lecanosticta acicola]